VSNIFNQYQDDFDKGKYRDSNYVYGPSKPRTIYFGLKLFN
jgi:outer membrane receptor for ferrienterochelin and colicins